MSLVKLCSCSSWYKSTVKPAHAVTSIKQPPALKGHIFLVRSYKISYELILFLRGHLSYKVTLFLWQRWPLNTGLTVDVYEGLGHFRAKIGTMNMFSLKTIHILQYTKTYLLIEN